MRMTTLRRVLAAGPAGWFDAAGLVVLAIAAEVSIRVQPLPVVARRFGCPIDGAPTDAHARQPLSAWERRRHVIVEALMRRWPLGDRDGLCLRRALLLGWVLRRRRPVLRIGVALQDGTEQVTAHAWLELEGRTLGADAVHRAFDFGGASDVDTRA